MQVTLVFVHGWSVTNLNTYGNLPRRLQLEGRKKGIAIEIRDIFLGRYISFHDEVRLPDISRAFQAAIADQLADVPAFVCITHSTGGPVVRDWWTRYWAGKRKKPPMTHLIMLAPANFGSALAQLGKGTLSRLQSWWNGVEPGQGVLDWLSLGSAEAMALNIDWIRNGATQLGPTGPFPFVLTGQSIDRKLYDVLNSYTGESGSDGVVRVAAANLQATYIRLEQPKPVMDARGRLTAAALQVVEAINAPAVPLRILARTAHSGKAMGIMAGVGEADERSIETVTAIIDCIGVQTRANYEAITAKFAVESGRVQQAERVEVEKRLLLTDRYFIHDRYSMIIFRVTDSEGYAITDFDLLLTAGPDNDPNLLPEGFFLDRQQNHSQRNTITYFINYDIMVGAPEVLSSDGKLLRPKTPGIDRLGIHISPRPDAGFVRYLTCRYIASEELLQQALKPNSTTIIDIVMQRTVDKEVFRMEHELGPKSFAGVRPSGQIVD